MRAVSPFDYWRSRAKEAWMKARVRVEAILFILFLCSGVILFRTTSPIQIDKTFWTVGFGTFIALFLFELCFVSPYHHAKKLTEELKQLRDAENKDFEETYYSIVKWITGGHYPLYALQEHNVDEFRSNDDVVRLCDRLVSDKHPNPFDIISTVIPKSDWLYFLKWARGRGVKFYGAHDTLKWATDLLKERGGRTMVEVMKEHEGNKQQ
jgi:hypothetical protein